MVLSRGLGVYFHWHPQGRNLVYWGCLVN